MPLKTITAALMLTALAAAPSFAQESGHVHGSMEAPNTTGDTSPSSKAFAIANAKMHKDMDIAFTGKTDLDFVRGMIAHHQGAIDMAKIELEHGKDEEIRKLAENIIKAQEAEIKVMKEWLAKNGG
ncbi:CopM family metallochaperone [Sinorhizobium terangae]|uniref:DUF305 domain-containing protein n=1 Tax=Sinorhizobium terangae TaxID=110322 RepID=A0A6N7LCE4_SINTE|nr:DUF305 domain-containing protein [Sinorhizobium terangae]MBB4184106.1 uncharacterized protein (DUF305 family) [Sinorhizobium terangae]MQX14879.1 DUF305 domain-containing protein [Sinorhizobium terangae]WFU48206.1 DUF305 domain-containing protein [Sinorhizobium terangae]